MGLLITLVLGLFIGVGAWISHATKDSKVFVQISVAVAFGTLSALAILELAPEAFENLGKSNWYVMLLGVVFGVLILKILDEFVPDHDDHHGSHGHEHEVTEKNIAHIGVISAIAVTLHNIIEGMAVYSLSEQSVRVGLLVALGVGLHNIPMGMIIHSTLRAAKRSHKIAMIAAASLSTFAGGILMWLLWGFITEYITGILISVTLGMVLYIVVFELIPMLLHVRNWRVAVPGALTGVCIILISTYLG